MPPDRGGTQGGEPPVASPCVSVCVLDPGGTGVCTGCGRTMDEIASWIDLTNDERRAVIDRLPERLSALRARNRARHWGDDADR
jgi:predicted Fe-S protein YdhL (DUF1289 family)